MKALRWHGSKKVSVDRVPDPIIQKPTDAIIKVTASAICGSDLHLYHGYIPTMEDGDILGHEFMGTVIETGEAVNRVKVGDKVVVPFNIGCGTCPSCHQQLWALCDTSNPEAALQRKLTGTVTSALFGYSHVYGGIPGGQAEMVRVPYADVGPIVVPQDIPDERVLFLSDILPTAWMAAEQSGIQPGETVAVWGCGPVGLLTMRCAWMLGAGRVIAVDEHPYRLEKARSFAKAETIDFSKLDVVDELRARCAGEGPSRCIDAVGMEAHGHSFGAVYDYVKQAVKLETDRPQVLRQAIQACRKGGTVSIPGVYGGMVDSFPLGFAFNKGLTLRMGQTHSHRYMGPLLQRILHDEIDPSEIISHRLPLSEAATGYDVFSKKKEHCVKVVLKP